MRIYRSFLKTSPGYYYEKTVLLEVMLDLNTASGTLLGNTFRLVPHEELLRWASVQKTVVLLNLILLTLSGKFGDIDTQKSSTGPTKRRQY